jgi:paxillin
VGQTLNAGTKSYHPDGCFVCSVCKSQLDGKFFASTTGDLLCEHHYFMENGRICGGENSGGCGKPIIAGKIVTTKAEGKYPEIRFHKDHFECAYCHKNMAGQKYKRHLEKFYCSQCHLQLFE